MISGAPIAASPIASKFLSVSAIIIPVRRGGAGDGRRAPRRKRRELDNLEVLKREDEELLLFISAFVQRKF